MRSLRVKEQAWVAAVTLQGAVGGARGAQLGAGAARDAVGRLALALVREDVEAPHVLLQLRHPALHARHASCVLHRMSCIDD